VGWVGCVAGEATAGALSAGRGVIMGTGFDAIALFAVRLLAFFLAAFFAAFLTTFFAPFFAPFFITAFFTVFLAAAFFTGAFFFADFFLAMGCSFGEQA